MPPALFSVWWKQFKSQNWVVQIIGISFTPLSNGVSIHVQIPLSLVRWNSYSKSSVNKDKYFAFCNLYDFCVIYKACLPAKKISEAKQWWKYSYKCKETIENLHSFFGKMLQRVREYKVMRRLILQGYMQECIFLPQFNSKNSVSQERLVAPVFSLALLNVRLLLHVI